MNSKRTLELQWPMDLERFGDYRERIRVFFREHVYWVDIAEDMVLGLDEALTNIVEHSCAGRPEEALGPIHIEVWLEAMGQGDLTHLRMLLRDRGEGGREFDMDQAHREEIRSHEDAAHRMGYGIIFLHRLMDRVDYRVNDSGESHLLLQKWFSNGPPNHEQLKSLVVELQRLEALPEIEEWLLEELASTHPEVEVGEQLLILGAILDVEMVPFRQRIVEARLNLSATDDGSDGA